MKKYIGSFGVDSGQVLIGDPCYLDNWQVWDGKEFDPHNHKGEYGYLGACGVTLTDGYGEIGQGVSAVVSSTGWGDGVYPVYATIDEDGRVARLEIVFISDEDEGES